MKQACRDELVVYLLFSSTIYTSLYFYVLSTVLRKSNFNNSKGTYKNSQHSERGPKNLRSQAVT